MIGTATVAGTLNISLINGFIPNLGTTDFTILNATLIAGMFATVNFPTIAGVTWEIIYTDPTKVIVRAQSTLSIYSFNKNTLKIYPNPTTGIVNFNLDENTTIFIYNILGKELLTVKKESGMQNIDLSNYSKGVYFLKLINEKGESMTKKIIRE